MDPPPRYSAAMNADPPAQPNTSHGSPTSPPVALSTVSSIATADGPPVLPPLPSISTSQSSVPSADSPPLSEVHRTSSPSLQQSQPQQRSSQDAPVSTPLAAAVIPADSPIDEDVKVAQYRRARPLFMTFMIIATTTLSWILLFVANIKTCGDMLDTMSDYTQSQIDKLIRAAWILHTVGALLAITAITTILSTGAVMLTMRDGKVQSSLNIRQMFALADGRWAAKKLRTGQPGTFSALACSLSLLALVTPFLQSVLVRNDVAHVMYCAKGGPWTPFCEPSLGASRIQSMIARTTSLDCLSGYSSTIDASVALFENPWDSELAHGNRIDPLVNNATDLDLWVSTVSKSLITGPVRQATIRTDNSATCEVVDRDSWPRDCTSYNTSDVTSNQGYYRMFSIAGAVGEVCAPPDASASWKDVRTLIYQASEAVYISGTIGGVARNALSSEYFSVDGFSGSNFSVKCTSLANNGFYEIPNPSNGFTDGPVFTSTSQFGSDVFVPINTTWSSGANIGPYSPFRTAVLSIFGARSYFQTLLATTFNTNITTVRPGSFCDNSPLHGSISGVNLKQPTDIGSAAILMHLACSINMGLSYDSSFSSVGVETLSHANSIMFFFSAFADLKQGAAVLKLALDSAYEAIHTTQRPSSIVANQVPIIGGNGHMVLTATFGKPAMVIMWVATALELIFLIAACIWAIHRKTWTSSLDAFAIARITSERAREGIMMPPTHRLVPNDIAELERVDGMVRHPAEGGEDSSLETRPLRAGNVAPGEPADSIELRDRSSSADSSGSGVVSPVPPVVDLSPTPQSPTWHNSPRTVSSQVPRPMPPPQMQHLPPIETPWSPEAAAEAALVMDGLPMGPNNREIPAELTMPTIAPPQAPVDSNDNSLPPSYASLHQGSGSMPPPHVQLAEATPVSRSIVTSVAPVSETSLSGSGTALLAPDTIPTADSDILDDAPVSPIDDEDADDADDVLPSNTIHQTSNRASTGPRPLSISINQPEYQSERNMQVPTTAVPSMISPASGTSSAPFTPFTPASAVTQDSSTTWGGPHNQGGPTMGNSGMMMSDDLYSMPATTDFVIDPSLAVPVSTAPDCETGTRPEEVGSNSVVGH